MSSPLARCVPLVLLAAALSLAIHPGRGFYMPPAFNADAEHGRDNSTIEYSQSRTSTAFDPRNLTGTGAEVGMPLKPTQTAAPTSHASGIVANESSKVVQILPRDVWNPPIVEPDSDTVWKVGSTFMVTWDVSTRPEHVTNWDGEVVLGYLQDGDSTDEHLDFEHPLARGFNLTQGKVEITVPNVVQSNDYIIVLFGDSGNRSQKFTIVN